MKKYILYRKIILLIFIFGFVLNAISQQNKLDFFYSNKVDSAVAYTYDAWDKETMAMPTDKEVKDTFYYKVISKRRLSNTEISELNTHILAKPSELNGSVALLSSASTAIDYYKNGKAFQHIVISLMTGRVSIIRDDCKQLKDEGYSCIFYGGAKPKFKTFILKLMKKKGLWSKNAKFGIPQ